MTLTALILTLVIIGIIMYLINYFVPMEPKIKSILNVAVVVFLIIWLLQAFGFLASLNSIRIGR